MCHPGYGETDPGGNEKVDKKTGIKSPPHVTHKQESSPTELRVDYLDADSLKLVKTCPALKGARVVSTSP